MKRSEASAPPSAPSLGGQSPDRERRESPVALRFLGSFAVFYFACHFLFKGSGPVAFINRFIDGLTLAQTVIAARILSLMGEPVIRSGSVLWGGGFSCGVAEGCNGMAAVNLVLAGTLAFPASWRLKALGLLMLVPGVLVVNLLRIVALYWTGVHQESWFVLVHIYIGQVAVIAATGLLWWIWLSWTSRRPVASS